MKNSKISKYFLFISISTFITIFFFIAQKSYGNLMEASYKVQSDVNLKPINPNLDIFILDQIDQRQHYLNDIVAPPASNSALQNPPE